MRTFFGGLSALLVAARATPAQEPSELIPGLPFCLSTLQERRIEWFLPREITVGMSFDLAASALRAAGAREGRFFDFRYRNPPPNWLDFALPSRWPIVTLHAASSDLFPTDFYITGIFLTYPNEVDLGGPQLKAHRRVERVEKFTLP